MAWLKNLTLPDEGKFLVDPSSWRAHQYDVIFDSYRCDI